MADIQQVATPQTSSNSAFQQVSTPDSSMQGVSNPPDGGQVLDSSPQSTDMSGTSDSANQNPDQAQAVNAANPQPQGSPDAPQAPQAPQSTIGPNDTPTVAQPPKQQPKPVPAANGTPNAVPADHPAVQRASLIHTIATTLAGGPKFKYSVDEYGNMQKQAIPMSRSDIGMAIALEALSGAVTGLGVAPGPNAAGRAAAAAMGQSDQRVQQQDQQAKSDANEDYARRAQVLETNMRMHQNALSIGKQTGEMNDAYIGEYKDISDFLQKNFPGSVKGVATYNDFGKYNATSDNAVPYQRVPRLNPDGSQAKGKDGEPAWDINYLIVDPSLKASGLLNKEDAQTLSEMGKNVGDVDNIHNLPLTLRMAINLKSQASSYRIAKQGTQNFFDDLSKANDGELTAPNKPVNTPGTLTVPPVYNGKFADVADKTATTNGVDPAIIRGILNAEHGMDKDGKILTSHSGAVGPMQVMPGTAKQMGYTPEDLNDPEKNIEIGTKYFASLLKQPNINGNVKLAIAAYQAGPGSIKNGQIPNTTDGITPTPKYVQQIADAIGLDRAMSTQPSDQSSQPSSPNAPNGVTPVNLAEAIKKDAGLPDALTKFQAIQNKTGNIGEAIEALSKQPNGGPDAAAKITALYGGMDNVRKVDNYHELQLKDQQEQLSNKNKEDHERATKQQGTEEVLRNNAHMIDALANDQAIDFRTIATMRSNDREKIFDAVKARNPSFNPSVVEDRIKLQSQAMGNDDKSTGYAAKVGTFNTMLQHNANAQDAINNLAKSSGTNSAEILNKTREQLNKQFGNDPNWITAKRALDVATTDWQNAINNNHALQQSDKDTAKDAADVTQPLSNALASLREMAHTGVLRMDPLDQQWVQTMPGGAHHPNFIEPKTVEAVKKMNDPYINDALKDYESGGTLYGGQYGLGGGGHKVGDLLKSPIPPSIPKTNYGYDNNPKSPTYGSVVAYRDAQGNVVKLQSPYKPAM